MIPDVLKTRFGTWSELEGAIEDLPGTKERGDALEAFAYFYLKYFRVEQEVLGEPEFPIIAGAFSKETRDALTLDTRDYGIDGVFRRVDGTITAVQCKFRADRHVLTYGELATFWSEAYKADYHLVFTNATGVTKVAQRRDQHLAITLEHLLALDAPFFDALHRFSTVDVPDGPLRPKKRPRPYQERALQDVLRGLESEERGKLTAACGIGKTLIALWVAEERKDKKVIFVAPNLQLIRQTLREWSLQATDPFRFLAVCSDTDVASEVDEIQSPAEDSDVRTTTDARAIAAFLRGAADETVNVIFSTYQSLPRVVEACRVVSAFRFDIAFFDEAHRTAGPNLASGFSIGLDGAQLPADKRLFMTATERLYAPRAMTKAEESGVVVFSMDQPEVYGPTFHSLSFRQAIEQEIICDYEIVVAAITERSVQQKLAETIWLRDDGDAAEEPVETAGVVAALTIARAAAELGTRKIVSFHATVRSAKRLAEPPLNDYLSLGLRDHAYHVNGSMSPGSRAQVLDDFADADTALVTNARCLVEGVDIPIIDAICFVTPKTSLIDIVQAVGRAVRKPWGVPTEKVARILIPVVISEAEPGAIDESAFAGVFAVVQALREQDEALAQRVDEWNLRVSRGSAPTDGGGELITWVTAESVGDVDLEHLRETLELRIATVNARPGEHIGFVKPLGTGERGSNVDRLVRTMADYTPDRLRTSLIEPTLQRFPSERVVMTASQLRVNNNNVAHARKLGVIRSVGAQAFELTSIGDDLYQEAVDFRAVMCNQLLLYEEEKEEALYPYRLVAQFIAERGSIRYWDFLFGIYNTERDSPDEERIARAWARVDAIQQYYAALETANPTSQAILVDELNEVTGLDLVPADIWTDRTTCANQFRYFGNHLALYETIFRFPEVRPFRMRHIALVDDDAKQRLLTYLLSSGRGLGDSYGDFYWWWEAVSNET